MPQLGLPSIMAYRGSLIYFGLSHQLLKSDKKDKYIRVPDFSQCIFPSEF